MTRCVITIMVRSGNNNALRRPLLPVLGGRLANLATSLGQAVGMRNLLVNEYARIDTGPLTAAAAVAERDFTPVTRQAAGWVRAHGDS